MEEIMNNQSHGTCTFLQGTSAVTEYLGNEKHTFVQNNKVCPQIQDQIYKDASWLKCARPDLDLLIIYVCRNIQVIVHKVVL